MVANIIEILPLIKLLKAAYPDVTQPWYLDYAGILDIFGNIGLYFDLLKQFFLAGEYYPEPSKSVIIVHLDNFAAKK